MFGEALQSLSGNQGGLFALLECRYYTPWYPIKTNRRVRDGCWYGVSRRCEKENQVTATSIQYKYNDYRRSSSPSAQPGNLWAYDNDLSAFSRPTAAHFHLRSNQKAGNDKNIILKSCLNNVFVVRKFAIIDCVGYWRRLMNGEGGDAFWQVASSHL